MLSRYFDNVSRETFAQLEAYVRLLLEWNAKINLIGKTTEGEVWERHITDSWQLLEHIPETTSRMADFGSGAGLPGLVVAIGRPDLSITLVERDQRKSAFLRQAALTLGLRHVEIRPEPIEAVAGPFNVISARALAPLRELCAMAHPRLGKNAFCLFPKGENFAREVEEAKEAWNFEYRVFPSATNDKSCIISVSELMRKG